MALKLALDNFSWTAVSAARGRQSLEGLSEPPLSALSCGVVNLFADVYSAEVLQMGLIDADKFLTELTRVSFRRPFLRVKACKY